MGKKDIIEIFLLVAILAALLTLVLRTEVQADEIDVVETTEQISVVETTTEQTSTTKEQTAVIITTTTTEAGPTTIKYEDIPKLRELGTFKLTAYCICQECCGKSLDHPEYGITASGTRATPGRTVAADKSIPFGTKLYINGNTYIVEDRGGSVNGNVIDICFDNHAEASNFRQYAKVFEVMS